MAAASLELHSPARNELHRTCFHCKQSIDSQAAKATIKALSCLQCAGEGSPIYCSQNCVDQDLPLHRAVCKKADAPDSQKVAVYAASQLIDRNANATQQKCLPCLPCLACCATSAASAASASSSTQVSLTFTGFEYAEVTYDPKSKEIESSCAGSINLAGYSLTYLNHLKDRVSKKGADEIVVVARPSGQEDYTVVYMFKAVHIPPLYKIPFGGGTAISNIPNPDAFVLPFNRNKKKAPESTCIIS